MKKRTMSTRLSINYALLIIIMIGSLAIIFYKYNQYKIYEEGMNHLRQISESSMQQIDSRLTNMEQVTVEVLSNNEFIKAWEAYSLAPDKANEEIIKTILSNAYINRNDIRRVTVFSENGVFCSMGKTDASKELVKGRAEYIQQYYHLNVMNSRVFLSSDLDFWNRASKDQVVSEIKPIKDQNAVIIGYIEIQQNLLYMNRICDIKWNGNLLKVLIFTGDNDDFFYSNSEAEESYIREVAAKTKQYTKVREEDKRILYTVSSNYYTARAVFVLEKGILNYAMQSILTGILVSAVLLILLTTIYIIIITRRVMEPINILTKRMASTDLYNINEKNPIMIRDRETEILVNSFDEMTKRLQETIKRQKKMEEAQVKTLFSILQSEIGPHFLYNTLGSIANMCEQGETEAAADACYSLTEILRYSSDYAVSEVQIKEEINNLKAYFAIMKSRYRQRLEYELTLDEEAKNLLIPKLTYQPLVENAIRYSLMEKKQVVVKVYTVLLGNEMIIEIKDNGCGISEETINSIDEKIKQMKMSSGEDDFTNSVSFGGMGLSGTLMRLSIYYGDKFSYLIRNNNDEGGITILLKMNIVGYR
ncbi:MAG TPA: histidine kinase [Clostridiales bacterium]|nr:histidine kinase [Clostridiales bacterium]